MICRNLPPLEFNPDELDPKVVALIRAHKPSKQPDPNAAIEETIRQELEEAA